MRIIMFLTYLFRGAVRPAPIIDGQPYHFGVWNSITLAWFLSSDRAATAFHWLPRRLRQVRYFLDMVWRPCQSDEHGDAILMSIECAWSLAESFAADPHISFTA